MKKCLKPLIVAATLVALGTLNTQADGLYLGGSVGSSHYRGDAIGGEATSHGSTAYDLYGGYAFSPYLGLELGDAKLGSFHSSAGEYRINGLYLDAVGSIPLAGSLSALGRLGVYGAKLDTSTEGSDHSTDLKLGLGLEYKLTDQVGLRGEWTRYRFEAFGSKPDADVYSVGLNYHF
jgi:OOP family OmpA-OmpF porin